MSKLFSDYLKSSDWGELRRRRLMRAMNTCEHCNKAPATEVHHVVRPADPRNDHIDYLVALCSPCHRVQMEEAHIKARTAMPKVPKSELMRHPLKDFPFWFCASLGGWYITLERFLGLDGAKAFKSDPDLARVLRESLQRTLEVESQFALVAPRFDPERPVPVRSALESDGGKKLYSWDAIAIAVVKAREYKIAKVNGPAQAQELIELEHLVRHIKAMLHDGLTRLAGLADNPAQPFSGELPAALQLARLNHEEGMESDELITGREFLRRLALKRPGQARLRELLNSVSEWSKERLDSRLGKKASQLFGAPRAEGLEAIHSRSTPVAARPYKHWSEALEAVVADHGGLAQRRAGGL